MMGDSVMRTKMISGHRGRREHELGQPAGPLTIRAVVVLVTFVVGLTITACTPVADTWSPDRVRLADAKVTAVNWSQGWVAQPTQPSRARKAKPTATRRLAAKVARSSSTPEVAAASSTPKRALRPAPARCDWSANLRRATGGRAANWTLKDTGAWGRTEVPGNTIWIAPRTPCDKVYSVAVHEWTHHMQGVVYGDYRAAKRAMARYGGLEIVADCGALLLGATWINYGCPGGASKAAAAAILRGERP